MLVDVDPGTPDQNITPFLEALGESLTLVRIGRGLYVGSINAANIFPDVIKDSYPFDPWPPPELRGSALRDWQSEQLENFHKHGWPDSSYGVSDSIEQVIERFPCIETDPRPLIVIGTEIRRADQPDWGGWRWHKWGPYIGDHEPQHEYLYDEDAIDAVWVWHVYEVEVK